MLTQQIPPCTCTNTFLCAPTSPPRSECIFACRAQVVAHVNKLTRRGRKSWGEELGVWRTNNDGTRRFRRPRADRIFENIKNVFTKYHHYMPPRRQQTHHVVSSLLLFCREMSTHAYGTFRYLAGMAENINGTHTNAGASSRVGASHSRTMAQAGRGRWCWL